MLSQKRAWLITAALAAFIYLVVYITRLFIPLLRTLYPYDHRTMWLYALVFLPFGIVLALFLFNTALGRLAKFATFLGILTVYAPLILVIINSMAAIIFFPIIYLLMPLFDLEGLLKLEGGSAPFFDSAVIEEIVPVLIAVGAAVTIVGLSQIVIARRNNRLAADGLYATMRHPQHLGIIIWALGFTLGGASWLHFFCWLTLVYVLVLLALREESRLIKQSGMDYDAYSQGVPFMLPLKLPGRYSLPATGKRRTVVPLAVYLACVAVVTVVYLVL